MKYLLLMGYCFLMLCSSPLSAAFGGGSGTSHDPYLIYTREHLLEPVMLTGRSTALYVMLMDDIDFKGQECPPLFTQWGFSGVFDGNGKSIKNLYMGSRQGFIRQTTGASTVLKNLTLVNSTLIPSQSNAYSGLLIGTIGPSSTVDNCHVVNCSVQASINSRILSGGLAGSNNGVIQYCSFSGRVSGYRAGGLTGGNGSASVIKFSHASVDLRAGGLAGGLAAYNSGLISDCSSRGTVFSATADWAYAGGLVGENSGASSSYYLGNGISDGNGTILNSYSHCSVSSSGKAAGGLVGNSWGGVIYNCYATGSVTGYSYLGGLVGTIQTTASYAYMGVVENCFSTGNVSGHDRIGGLVGENGSAIVRNSYSLGQASGVEVVGGLVGCVYLYPNNGYGTAITDQCYSTGKVTGSSETGGLIGRHWNGTQIVTNSFWDTQSSGWTYSAGGTGKTTAQLQTQTTFTRAGWNFSTLWYLDKYPILRWELNPLQASLDAAQNGDVIVVEPGVYSGRLFFLGKTITLTSLNPTDPAIVQSTVLRGKGGGPIVTFAGNEAATCSLEGFTLTDGFNPLGYGGSICGNESMAAVRHCIFRNNTSPTGPGGAIWGIGGGISGCTFENNHATSGGGLARCHGVISNCLMVRNTSTSYGTALNNCDGLIQNCTIVNDPNSSESLINMCDGVIENCILQPVWGSVFSNNTATVRYCCYPSAEGEGNIFRDPLFVDPASGDFHLLPDSPCIDAGHPASDFYIEPKPNGRRINMGVYGNTPEATRSRDGLIPLGFEIIGKTRIGRTAFDYELAVIVRNTNSFDITDVRMQLISPTAAVLSVADDYATFEVIYAGETQTSEDTFTLTLDRSLPVRTGRLTWELTYYVPMHGGWVEQAFASLPLSVVDPKPGDITGDGEVNLKDLEALASQWGTAPSVPSADIALPYDGVVGLGDLQYLAEHWLE